jgi:hypothetical protein
VNQTEREALVARVRVAIEAMRTRTCDDGHIDAVATLLDAFAKRGTPVPIEDYEKVLRAATRIENTEEGTVSSNDAQLVVDAFYNVTDSLSSCDTLLSDSRREVRWLQDGIQNAAELLSCYAHMGWRVQVDRWLREYRGAGKFRNCSDGFVCDCPGPGREAECAKADGASEGLECSCRCHEKGITITTTGAPGNPCQFCPADQARRYNATFSTVGMRGCFEMYGKPDCNAIRADMARAATARERGRS